MHKKKETKFSLTSKPFPKEVRPFLLVILLLIGGIAYGWYEYRLLDEANFLLTTHVAELEQSLRETQSALEDSQENSERLAETLEEKEDTLESIEDSVDEVTGIVSDLQKLEEIEVELLQKYSKIYFLNEHYEPKRLKEIDEKYLYNGEEPEYIDARVLPFLEDLLDEAEDDGIELFVASGYRSFGEQGGLKAAYTVTYGSGANTFSADQGYSEHQLGTTVDFLTTGIGGTLSGFGNTEAYEWLLDNAHQFGFVLSYPEGNAYYIFEPWHWRFVGEDLADDLQDEALFFYDLSQKEIDTYRLELFD